jgi:hypothetical protein
MQWIGQSAGKSFAYLLGVYLGDGCVTRAPARKRFVTVFRLNSIDPDFVEATKAALINLGCGRVWTSTHPVKKSVKPNHSLTAKADDICAALVSATNAKASLPQMDGWSRDEKLALVSGLMDSEGFVAATANPTNRRYYMGFKCCERWVPDFQALLDSLGIRSGKLGTEVPRREGYRVPMRFTIKMQSWIDSGAQFNIARKQQRVNEWGSAGAYEHRAKFPRRLTSETIRQTPTA